MVCGEWADPVYICFLCENTHSSRALWPRGIRIFCHLFRRIFLSTPHATRDTNRTISAQQTNMLPQSCCRLVGSSTRGNSLWDKTDCEYCVATAKNKPSPPCGSTNPSSLMRTTSFLFAASCYVAIILKRQYVLLEQRATIKLIRLAYGTLVCIHTVDDIFAQNRFSEWLRASELFVFAH